MTVAICHPAKEMRRIKKACSRYDLVQLRINHHPLWLPLIAMYCKWFQRIHFYILLKKQHTIVSMGEKNKMNNRNVLESYVCVCVCRYWVFLQYGPHSVCTRIKCLAFCVINEGILFEWFGSFDEWKYPNQNGSVHTY